MAHLFTSLRHPLEKLQEAEYFLIRLPECHDLPFQFNLNAFLSASRSTTFVLQACLADVPYFEDWYASQQLRMKSDKAMRFFVELRNVSQKRGPVSYVGGAAPNGRHTHRFVSSGCAVPPELVGKDIAKCCAEHLMKLAQLLNECREEFPFQCCPKMALTEEGMKAVNYTLTQVEAALGLAPGWTDVTGIPLKEKLRILGREVEPLDISELARLAGGHFEWSDPLLEEAPSGDLVDDIAAAVDRSPAKLLNPRALFIEAIARRIDRIERDGS